MIIETRNDRTLIVRPETVAEQTFLATFEGAKIQIEKPQPFANNVSILKIERPKEAK